jgi:hypothetical protein
MATVSSNAIKRIIKIIIFHLKSGFLKIAFIAADQINASQNPAPIPHKPTANQAHKRPKVFITYINKYKDYSSVATLINIAVNKEKTNA